MRNNEIILFDHIREVYVLNKKNSTGKALSKLKIHVRLVMQVLRQSGAAAIRTAVDTKEPPQAANVTATFIETIDNAFDELNSKSLISIKLSARALSIKNLEVVNALNKAYTTMKSLRKVDNNGGLTRPPCKAIARKKFRGRF